MRLLGAAKSMAEPCNCVLNLTAGEGPRCVRWKCCNYPELEVLVQSSCPLPTAEIVHQDRKRGLLVALFALDGYAIVSCASAEVWGDGNSVCEMRQQFLARLLEERRIVEDHEPS